VQGGERIWLGVKLRAQRLGEELVVAAPAALEVDRHQEQVGPLQVIEDALAVRVPQRRLGEARDHPAPLAGQAWP
jgi:hypothetical protein